MQLWSVYFCSNGTKIILKYRPRNAGVIVEINGLFADTVYKGNDLSTMYFDHHHDSNINMSFIQHKGRNTDTIQYE